MKNMYATSLILSVVLFSTNLFARPSFPANTDFTTEGNPRSVSMGEMHGDGIPDLTVAGSHPGTASVLFSTSPSVQTEACITWDLLSSGSVTSVTGNIGGQPEIISAGTSFPPMSIFDYNNGQRLWVGTNGWVAGPLDLTRYVEFQASPQSGNTFTVSNVSFEYGDNQLSTDFQIINFKAYYSTDGWLNSTVLNSTALVYMNTAMSTFTMPVNVVVPSGQTFALRIYPYALQNGLAMTPTFAIHKNVVICGTTAPEVPSTGSICGTKFNDLNGNGVQDAAEPGLPNWIINLSYNQATGPVTLIDTTDANGNYCFNGLQGGGIYTVSETNQTGWQQTFPSSPGTHTATLAAGETIDSLNFGNRRDAGEACITWDLLGSTSVTSISGSINGQPEIISAGTTFPPMSIFDYNNGQRLWVGTNGWVAGPLDLTRYVEFQASPQTGNTFTVTNVSFEYGDNQLSTDFQIINFKAYYSIDGWSTGTVLNSTALVYLNTTMSTFTMPVNVVVPSGQTFSLRIYPYALQNGLAMTPTFAIHKNVVLCGTTAPEVPSTGSICGTKFNDLNGNGVQDAAEPGLPNWEIGLGIATVPPVLTDSLGDYCFNNLPAGTYTLTETNQSGWQQTFPSSPGTHTVTLAAGQTIDSLNFGNKRDAAEACITWDLMNSTLVTSASGNIAGTPESMGVGSPLLSTGLAANLMSIYGYSNGQQLWVGNTGGTWVPDPPSPNTPLLDPLRYVQFDASATTGNTLTVSSVSFNYGDLPWSTNFGILAFQAYYSTDGWANGTVLNLTPLVYLNTTMTSFTQTILGGVPVPSGQTFSLRIYPYPVQHGIAIMPSFATHNNVVICGTTAPDVARTGSICGTKFNDLNGNGVKDEGEPGLPNWQISLNIATIPFVITDKDGNFCFNNVPAGTYTVSEVMQSGWQQTAPATGSFTVTLAAGQSITGLLFGNRLEPCGSGTKAWSPLGTGTTNGTNGEVRALAVMGTDLYVGGNFTTAGGNTVNHIAKWNGTNWTAVGTGINGTVNALAIIGTDLYAGGEFTTAGSASANSIAKWNGTNWTALGSGIDGPVQALAVMGGDLYAGGTFTTAGGVTAHSVAKWSGSSWSALGAGIGNSGYLYTLAAIGTDLYAGGAFFLAGGVSASHVAKWNGSNWSALGSGVSSTVTSLGVMGTDLYAGGDFSTAGGGSVNRIARWDGISWSALGSGMTSDYVRTIKSIGADLYAGGDFSSTGGVSTNRIAKWDGSNWSALGIGMNLNYVQVLAEMGGDLYAGGWFTLAGGVSANHIARYSCAVATSVDESKTGNTIPQQFKLEQNYPNPFNPGTTIGFGVPVKSFVRVTIYDVLGRHLATLVEGELAAGSYQKYWNASGLPSGVYIYRMEAGAFRESKKLFLLK